MLKKEGKGIFYNTSSGHYHIKFTFKKYKQVNVVAKIKLDSGNIRYAENREEAKLAIAQYIANGGPIDKIILKKNTSLLSECIKEYIIYCQTMDKKRTDLIEKYCNYFLKFLADKDYKGDLLKAQNNIKIQDITTNDFINYTTYRKQCEVITYTKKGPISTGRCVTNATINRERNSIKGLFRYLHKTLKLLENNPCDGWEALPVTNKVKQPPDTTQEKQILQMALREDYALFVMLILFTTLGARKSEVHNLLWENTHLEASAVFPNGYIDFINRKNGKNLRLPLSSDLRDLLLNMPRLSEYVFTNPKTGTKYTNRYKKLNKILEETRVKKLGIGYHIFRHSAATNLEQNGVEVSTIKEILGNTTNVVLSTYLNQGVKRKQEVINLTSERIRKLMPKQENLFFRQNLDKTAKIAQN